MEVAQARPHKQLDYLDFEKAFSTPKAQHGGYRPGAGRPRGSQSRKTIEKELRRKATHELLLEHVLYKEKVSYLDKNGNVRTKRRVRLLLILDALFARAMTGDIQAISVYLDRTIGKPGYMPGHYPSESAAARAHRDEPEAEQRVPSKAMIEAAKAYRRALAEEEA